MDGKYLKENMRRSEESPPFRCDLACLCVYISPSILCPLIHTFGLTNHAIKHISLGVYCLYKICI